MFLHEHTVIIKGGGEMGSGVAAVLFQAGIRRILLLEIPKPLAVRRAVSFCEAVYERKLSVEGITARLASSPVEIEHAWMNGEIAVAVDPDWKLVPVMQPRVLIDATLAKRNLGTRLGEAPLVIALGPGFTAGQDAHLVIETQRGHNLGRIYRQGSAEPNTGIPGAIEGYTVERVLRAPRAGVVQAVKCIGDMLKAGETVCLVDGYPVNSAIDGVLRGIIRSGLPVEKGLKLGDVDPRGRAELCYSISEKARALGGAALNAVCSALPRLELLPASKPQLARIV